jgi:predicted N-acetyltransferase YhbS
VTLEGAIGFEISAASAEELAAALRVQHEGFGRVAAQFGIPVDELPAAHETLEGLAEAVRRGASVLVARVDGEIVGTVRSWQRDNGVVEIGRLAVLSSMERRGIGRALLQAAEAAHPDATRLELFTGAEADGPLALYESLGYRVFQRDPGPHVDLVWLAKARY